MVQDIENVVDCTCECIGEIKRFGNKRFMIIDKIKISDVVENMNESRKYRRVNSALFGDPTGKIVTFAIVCPENPMGALGSDEDDYKEMWRLYQDNPQKYNRDSIKALKSELEAKIRENGDKTMRVGRFTYVNIRGHYGDSEHSMLIFNLTKSDAEKIAKDYGQESFFFAHVFDDHCDVAYYRTTNHCKTYKLVEISRTITDESEAMDFFSKFGAKFKINMREFGDDVPYIPNNGEFEESMNEKRTFMSRASFRHK